MPSNENFPHILSTWLYVLQIKPKESHTKPNPICRSLGLNYSSAKDSHASWLSYIADKKMMIHPGKSPEKWSYR